MITVHWHLIVVIVITIFLVIGMFKQDGPFDFSGLFCVIGLIVLWLIYGGIVWW
jgi:hypothetical protein